MATSGEASGSVGPRRFAFDAFEVDVRTGELRREGLRVPIQDVPFRFLVALLKRPGELVTREELRAEIWPSDLHLDFEAALDTAARKVRRALGDDPHHAHYVETLPGRGYRFCGAVRAGGIPERRRSASPMSKVRLAVGVGGLLLAAAGGLGLAVRDHRERGRLEAVVQGERRVQDGEFWEAATYLREVRRRYPADPSLERLWAASTTECAVTTDPPGARVAIRAHGESVWVDLGTTPLPKVRVPRAQFVWRMTKPGFVPWEALSLSPVSLGQRMSVTLDPEGVPDTDMVRVPGAPRVWLTLPGLREAPSVALADYRLGRTEVTNAAFKVFMDQGGYRRPEFWHQAFLKGGRTLSWEAAMAEFRDTTGHPGPATWVDGAFPPGQEQAPVAGISWFEAAAYAAFAGRQLPTVYQWSRASQAVSATLIIPGSHFLGGAPRRVGAPGALGGFGTYDMAGNVKEWCWNADSQGRRYLLGGGFGEPPYMFIDADAQSPWDRRPNVGFRCAKSSAPPGSEDLGPVDQVFRNYALERPVPDEVFRAYAAAFAYDRRDLNALVDVRETTDEWVREQVSLDAAYGGERITLHLYFPKEARPPFQSVVWFPYSSAIDQDRLDTSDLLDNAFIPKGGRVLVVPVYKGMYQRRGTLTSGHPDASATYRDHVVAWARDLGRCLDYLETRPDLDRGKRAFLGRSLGARIAPILLAIEERFQAAILVSGGLRFARVRPESDPFNFLPRVKVPVLMLNGRFDYYFPVETSQLPFLRTLGTPPGDRRHVLFDAAHSVPAKAWTREGQAWLDRYLGPVTR